MASSGQAGIVASVFLFSIFFVIYFVWLAGAVTEIGHSVVVDNGITGFEAFVFENLNLFIVIAAVLGMIGFSYFLVRGGG